MLIRAALAALCGMALAASAMANPPTPVLVTSAVQVLAAATSAPLTNTGPGNRMVCVQNIGTGLVTLNFGAAAVAGQGWGLNAAGGAGQGGGAICWADGTVPYSVIHAISTAGSTVVVLVGR